MSPDGQPHELAGAGGGEGAGFLAGIGGVAAEELGVGRVGDGDRQPELGGGGLEVFEEAESEAIRRLRVLGAAPSATSWSRRRGRRRPRSARARSRRRARRSAEGDEGHDVLAVGALGCVLGPAGDPGLEDLGDREEEPLDAFLDPAGRGAGEKRGEGWVPPIRVAYSVAGIAPGC